MSHRFLYIIIALSLSLAPAHEDITVSPQLKTETAFKANMNSLYYSIDNIKRVCCWKKKKKVCRLRQCKVWSSFFRFCFQELRFIYFKGGFEQSNQQIKCPR